MAIINTYCRNGVKYVIKGKLLVKLNNGITVMDLINLCSMEKLPLKTKIYPMGAETVYAIIDTKQGYITLDEYVDDTEKYTKLEYIL